MRVLHIWNNPSAPNAECMFIKLLQKDNACHDGAPITPGNSGEIAETGAYADFYYRIIRPTTVRADTTNTLLILGHHCARTEARARVLGYTQVVLLWRSLCARTAYVYGFFLFSNLFPFFRAFGLDLVPIFWMFAMRLNRNSWIKINIKALDSAALPSRALIECAIH